MDSSKPYYSFIIILLNIRCMFLTETWTVGHRKQWVWGGGRGVEQVFACARGALGVPEGQGSHGPRSLARKSFLLGAKACHLARFASRSGAVCDPSIRASPAGQAGGGETQRTQRWGPHHVLPCLLIISGQRSGLMNEYIELIIRSRQFHWCSCSIRS